MSLLEHRYSNSAPMNTHYRQFNPFHLLVLISLLKFEAAHTKAASTYEYSYNSNHCDYLMFSSLFLSVCPSGLYIYTLPHFDR